MKQIDRYIAGKFLKTFFYTVLLFTLISLVIDFADKSEELMREKVYWVKVLREYYINFIPHINGLLWPLFTLIAVIFFTSRMAKDSEFIAILNAGVSFRRMLYPYLLVSGLIAFLYFLGGHYVVPLANKVKFDFENTYIYKGNDQGKSKDVHLKIGENQKVFIRYYRKADTSARDVRIETIKKGQVRKVVDLKRMEWVRPPNIWRIQDYTIHEFQDSSEWFFNGMDSSKEIGLNVYPDDFIRFVNEKEQMTSPVLLDYITTEREKGQANLQEYLVEFHRRTAEAFSIIILTILGMSVASRKVRGGIGLHLAFGISLGAIFVFLSKFSITFASSQLVHPILGVWIPNIIFFIVALFLVRNAQQ